MGVVLLDRKWFPRLLRSLTLAIAVLAGVGWASLSTRAPGAAITREGALDGVRAALVGTRIGPAALKSLNEVADGGLFTEAAVVVASGAGGCASFETLPSTPADSGLGPVLYLFPDSLDSLRSRPQRASRAGLSADPGREAIPARAYLAAPFVLRVDPGGRVMAVLKLTDEASTAEIQRRLWGRAE